MISKLEDFIKFIETNEDLSRQQKSPYQKQAREIIAYLKAQQITDIDNFNVDNFLETYEGDIKKQMVKGIWRKIQQWINGGGFPAKKIEEVEVAKKRKAEKKKLKQENEEEDSDLEEQEQEEIKEEEPKIAEPKLIESKTRSNKSMPQHKITDKEVLGTQTKVHIYKRDSKAKLALIDEYELREIAPDGNIERFIKEHLVSKYGGGIYEVYKLSQDGANETHIRSLKFLEDNLSNNNSTDTAKIYNLHKEELVKAIEDKHAERENFADKMLEILSRLQKPNSSPTDALIQLQVLEQITEYMTRLKSKGTQGDAEFIKEMEIQLRMLRDSLQKPQQNDTNNIIPILMYMIKEFKEKPEPDNERFNQITDAVNNLRDEISNINVPMPFQSQTPQPGFFDKLGIILPTIMPIVTGYFEQQRIREEKINQQLQEQNRIIIETVRGKSENPELVRIIDKLSDKIDFLEEKINNPKETSIGKMVSDITALKEISSLFGGGEKNWFEQIAGIVGAFAQMQQLQRQQPQQQQQLLQQQVKPQPQPQPNNGGNGNIDKEQLKVVLDKYVLDILESQKTNAEVLKNMKMIIMADDENRMNTLAAILKQYSIPITDELLIAANDIVKQKAGIYIDIIDKNLSLLETTNDDNNVDNVDNVDNVQG